MALGRKLCRGLAAFVLAASLALPAAAENPIPAGTAVSPDPAVKRGTMANGLRYAIMPNATPQGGVSIRLAVNVGSYDENDSELGAAHFIEHMAFRSTRKAPDGILDNRFAALGVAMGRDQNAVTGLDRTMYSVDLPTNRPEGTRTILEWMREAADGILFGQAAVDIERGVVLAEKEARNSPMAQTFRETLQFQGKGLRSISREPIGTDASLRAATPASLKAFYERWYRPENAMLIIVGDAPAEELERMAIEIFASWKGKGPAAPRTAPAAAVAKRGLEAMARSNPAVPFGLSACRLTPPDPQAAPPIERMRREIYSQTWTAILNLRLTHLSSQAGTPLLNAGAAVERDYPDTNIACLMVMPTVGKWREALAVGQAELRRLGEAGPTETEVEQAIETLRSRLRAEVVLSNTRVSPVIANAIADAFLTGRVFQHPSEAMRTFDIAASGVVAADVKRAIAADWAGNGPLLVATAPEAPAQEQLLAAWRANESAAPLAAYADRATATWLYDKFGKPGRVVKRELINGGEFTRLHFENGTVLNFKGTKFQTHAAEIRISFGYGERGFAAATRMPAALAAEFFPTGGLGKMNYEEIGSAFTNSTWNFSLEIAPSTFMLSSSTLTSQVGQQMKLLAAYMTDPGFRAEMNDKLPTALDTVYRMYPTDPNMAALDALERAVYPGKETLPPREVMTSYDAAQFEQLLKPVLTRAPVAVTIVGDVSEAYAIESVANSFGALPTRPKLPEPGGPNPFRVYPASAPPPVRTTHQGPAEKAAALLVWPLYVANPERRSEEYAIGLVSTIFQTRLLQRVRGQMGKVYSPAVGDYMPDNADQGYLAATIEATPADLGALVTAARQIAAELAAGGITQQEVDEARAPLVAERSQAMTRNEAWAGVMSHSVRYPEALEELTRYKEMMEALTLADVRKAAATWLKPQPIVSTALPAGTR